MQAIVFGVLVLASVALAGDVAFRTCASAELAEIRRFGVSDCATGSDHCIFIKGNTYQFDIEAKSHGHAPHADELHYKVTGSVLGIPITLLEGDACHNMTAPNECPIRPGDDIFWSVEKEIGAETPAISNVLVTARIWANVKGTNAEAAACAQITVTIRNAAELKNLVESLSRHN